MDDLGTVLSLNDSPHHGLTLCLGSSRPTPPKPPGPKRRCAPTCRASTSRTCGMFKHYPNGDFSEVGHRACEGDVDTVGVMRAYAEGGYTGYLRPDHGRHLWTENTTNKPRPGYGLYDRGLAFSTCSASGTPPPTAVPTRRNPLNDEGEAMTAPHADAPPGGSLSAPPKTSPRRPFRAGSARPWSSWTFQLYSLAAALAFKTSSFPATPPAWRSFLPWPPTPLGT